MSDQTVVESKNTPLTPSEAANALSGAYQRVAGQAPSRDVLGLLMAQSALETANWSKIRNFNFGGIKATSGDGLVQVFTTTELVNGETKTMDLRFAAYANATDGATAYVRQLHARPHWWDGLHTGTPEGFVAGLTTPPAYFTAAPERYIAGLKARAQSLIAVVEQAVRSAVAAVSTASNSAVETVRARPKTSAAATIGTVALGVGAIYALSQRRARA